MSQSQFKAIRGATTVPANDAAHIAAGAAELVAEIMQRNRLERARIGSIIFTVTNDLNAAFPATGVRQSGLADVPLLCATEIPVPGSQERCIRCLVHVEAPAEDGECTHVYLHDARQLRPDLVPADAAPPAMAEPAHRPAIDRIVPYVPGKPIGEVQAEFGLADVIKLASNENSLGPAPAAQEAIKALAAGVHRYPDGAALRLRQALADRCRMAPEQIFVGNGSDEIIKLLAEIYLSPGDEVVFAGQTFSEYAYATRLMGATEVTVPLRHGRHDLDGMRQQITSRTKLVFVCNPNNPTGTYVGAGAVDRFLAGLPAGILVVLDEAYVDFADAPDFPDTLALIRAGRPVVSLRTFSKIYGLAGLRVGYCVAPAGVAARLHQVKEPFNVNLPAQVAALAALGDEEHVERSQRMNAAGKQQLYTGFARLRLRYWPSQANYVCVDVARPCQEVYEAMLRQGVIVRATQSFGLPTMLRITVGTEEENARCLLALERALQV